MEYEVYPNLSGNVWHVVIARAGHPALILPPAVAREKASEAESRGDHELASKLRASADQATRNRRLS
jgi:hypothetical protein